MRISVDLNVCESHGQCVFAAPEIFAFDDDDRIVHDASPPEALRERAETAAALCPLRAITVTDTA